jgi:hypothetical protein
MDGCNLQYSTDGGTTWTTVTGWGSFTQDCLPPGTPANPLDSDTDTLSCSIAAYFAQEVINAGIQHVVDEINDSKTLVQTVQSLLALGFLIDVPIALGLELGTLAFNVIQGLNLTDLQTGLSDTAYFGDVMCAIFEVIQPDGMITADNWAAVQAAIDAVTAPNAATAAAVSSYVDSMSYATAGYLQQQGPIYEGDCSGCGTWCYKYDFATGQHGWALVGGEGSWAGDSWLGINDSGGGFGHTELDVQNGTAYSPAIEATACSITYATTAADAHFAGSFVQFYGGSAGTVTRDIHALLIPDGANHTLAVTPPTGTFTHVYVRIIADGLGQTVRLRAVQLGGDGTNPLGTTNC